MVRRMTDGVERRESVLAWPVALALAGAAALRLVTAVVAGFVEWHDNQAPFLGTGRARAYDVLTTFGTAGDGTEVLLLIAAAAATYWALRSGEARAAGWWPAIGWMFGLTAVLAALQGIGFTLIHSLPPGHQTARLVEAEGFALAYLGLCVVGVVVVNRLDQLSDAQLLEQDDLDAFVFALDRRSGDVRAFLSAREAAARMHVYSVEDDEFTFYTDEGVVLRASVVGDRIALQTTEEERPDELLEGLKEFANRRGIKVDPEDADDATAYAVPIRRWHWLEMWPPWLRPIGMLFRRRP